MRLARWTTTLSPVDDAVPATRSPDGYRLADASVTADDEASLAVEGTIDPGPVDHP